jgi:1-acyl-sn-glycerol-3-phosphate acyltransferase
MAYWILKVVLTPLLRCLYRLDVKGKGNVPKRGPVILASNHQSFIDSVFLPMVVGRRVTFVAKAEYFENPRTAWIFRALGQIPIKRGGGSSSERALASAREVLDAGGVLGIYPEGTRSPDGRLYKGHTGVARLAVSCGAPVVPVSLEGTSAVQPIGAMRPRVFRPVAVRFGRPLTWPFRSAEAEHPAVLRRVTEEIMVAIAELSGQERVDHYGRRGAPRPSLPADGVPEERRGSAAAAPVGVTAVAATTPPKAPLAGPDSDIGPAPVAAVAAEDGPRTETASFRR